jgi:hypothetical protein
VRWLGAAFLVAGLLALGLPAPTVDAHGAQPPWTGSLALEGEPRTGSTVDVAVEVVANRDMDATFRLEVADHARPAGSERWNLSLEAGESATRTWELAVDGRGFWKAQIAAPDELVKEAACCVYAYSAPGRGLAGDAPEAAVPPPRAATGTSFAVAGPETVEANYTVSRGAAWMRLGAFELRHSLGGEEGQARAEEGQARAHHVFEVPLDEGERATVFVASHVRILFEGEQGGDEHVAFVHCRNVQIERTGDEVARVDDWRCHADRARGAVPTHPPDEATVPGPGAGSIGLAAALAGLATTALGARSGRR